MLMLFLPAFRLDVVSTFLFVNSYCLWQHSVCVYTFFPMQTSSPVSTSQFLFQQIVALFYLAKGQGRNFHCFM